MSRRKTTLRDVIKNTLEIVNSPLTPEEIWEKAKELNLLGDFSTTGKTPWATIGAYCYTDIKQNGEHSSIIQISKRPSKFFLRSKNHNEHSDSQQDKKETALISTKKKTTTIKERDLHPLLATFAYSDSHFKANLKTIYHENSKRRKSGKNEWLHPDIVGVYFPFQEYNSEVLAVQNQLSISSIRLFSFELKTSLDFDNLRESYFQAVSNSSWANEGYLVAADINEDSDFIDEIRRLNNAFGIGIIKLNIQNIHESEIIFPSKINNNIDWNTVNRLATENPDFSKFLEFIEEDCRLGKVKSKYDNVLNEEQLEEFLKNHYPKITPYTSA